jgi:hypothetical protein
MNVFLLAERGSQGWKGWKILALFSSVTFAMCLGLASSHDNQESLSSLDRCPVSPIGARPLSLLKVGKYYGSNFRQLVSGTC